MNTKIFPPDQSQRNAVLEDLDSTILVEAAAGTGKTTSIVGRMVRLLASGAATVDRMAAVTFTRKAAAELADRFRKALQAQAHACDPQQKIRLERAVLSLDRCFIGTIHSFCGRLLRERPLEAGLPMDFEEIDEQQDQNVRARVWDDFVEHKYRSEDPILGKLEEIGIQLEDLAGSFQMICGYEDVEEWPVDEGVMPDGEPALAELEEMVEHIEQLLQKIPNHFRKDDLMAVYERAALTFRQTPRVRSARQLMDILSQFKVKKGLSRLWSSDIGNLKEERERLRDFTERVAAPLLKQWREYRYGKIMQVLLQALDSYQAAKLQLCKLNFQDLLLYSARLLQKDSSVRRHFRKRFTHILVDEFQDTDPIQAEVLLYLTADDPCETNWKKCRPAPGSLFLVGDPKQSIYRFRRADVITYNEVKSIVRESGGKIIKLSANFRTVAPLIDWINGFFKERFAAQPHGTSPSYVALDKVIGEPKEGPLSGIRVLRLSQEDGLERSKTELDAYKIASIIRHAMDRKMEVPTKLSDNGEMRYRPVEPADFLIITPRLKHLHVYAKALQDFEIPYEVTGSATVNETEEVWLLYSVIRCIAEPHDPVALLAVLRGPLFGLSDAQLYDFKIKGGVFSFESEVPENLDDRVARAFTEAFARLRTYRTWLTCLPMTAALEKILDDSGLLVHAALGSGGNLKAGSVFKALEWLRKASRSMVTVHDLLDALKALVTKSQPHDAVPALARRSSAARLLNLHKVKGLEAPIVFLADPSGSFEHQPLMYIDRGGDKVLGYFAIHAVQGRGNNPVILAQPVNWDDYAKREGDFVRAEFLRLLYVAATRACSLLSISQFDKNWRGKKKHPWIMFSDALNEAPEWSSSFEEHKPHTIVHGEISEQEVMEMESNLSRQWESLTRPSYHSSGIKARTVVSEAYPMAMGENGAQRGAAIHALLEMAMVQVGIDLEQAGTSVLTGIGLGMEHLQSCIDAVRRVMSSGLWERARHSSKVMVETPFQLPTLCVDDTSSEAPLILRGVIDLVFEENGAWVLVDYKTDRIPEASLERLVEKYRGQVLAYAGAWTSITGQGVKEKGLYFTHLDRYVVLEPQANLI